MLLSPTEIKISKCRIFTRPNEDLFLGSEQAIFGQIEWDSRIPHSIGRVGVQIKALKGTAAVPICIAIAGALGSAFFNHCPPAQCMAVGIESRLNFPDVVSRALEPKQTDAGLPVPKSLRTDLKGTEVVIALPENAPDRRWDDELLGNFERTTGIRVKTIRPGNDTTAVLGRYQADLRSASPEADVYAIDIVWPGMLADFAEDLRPIFGNLDGVAPILIENDTVQGKLVAVPYFAEVSALYYRTDLIQKYRLGGPPRTWSEMEQQARIIQAGERAAGNKKFWGYLWQGSASEALTCNALEWQASEGGGALLRPDGSIGIARKQTARAWNRARGWVGELSPKEVTSQLEDDSLRIWKNGDAAFMRNWPYAYRESMRKDSRVAGKVGVVAMPSGQGARARRAAVLGGFQLVVRSRSRNKEAAIELVRYLTSPEVQRYNAIHRGYLPTMASILREPAVIRANPAYAVMGNVFDDGAIMRPATIAASRYDAVSSAYFHAVHRVISGETEASAAVDELEDELRRIMASR